MTATDPSPSPMRRALELASRGLGHVEPNPMVGCVLTLGDQLIGEGWHQRFGGPHAEIEALASLAPGMADRLGQATAWVTLEPCCHHGKTGPCSQALIDAGVGRVVVATLDPNPEVAGQGVARLREAGVEVEVGCLEAEARELLAPYLTTRHEHRPWVIAKWAMTLDGKIATANGDSQWISGPASRRRVHQLRGRVDGILVGSGTALADNPRLTARPPGPRTPVRVVLDTHARLPLDSHLVRAAGDGHTVVVVGSGASPESLTALATAGCRILRPTDWQATDPSGPLRLPELLGFFQQQWAWTNLLVEGGGQVLGSLSDAGLIDELQLFVGPRILGGAEARTPVAGRGAPTMAAAQSMELRHWEVIEQDLYAVYRRPAPG